MRNHDHEVTDPHDTDLAKKFTRACLKVGLLREIKPRRYVKPSMKRRPKSKAAQAKLAKTARRHAAGEAARLQRLGVKE